MFVRYLLLIVITLCTVANSSAQSRRRSSINNSSPKLEELPKRPLDTIATSDPETKIILYSNNTWSYFRPDLQNWIPSTSTPNIGIQPASLHIEISNTMICHRSQNCNWWKIWINSTLPLSVKSSQNMARADTEAIMG